MARSIFSRSEISCLWQSINLALPLPNGSRHHYIDVRLVDTILIMLYSGIRIGELLQIKTEQIDFKKQIIDLHGTKTKAAKRILPLHKEILPLIEARMQGTYLIEAPTGQKLNYDTYKKCFFDPLMAQLKCSTSPTTADIPLSAVWIARRSGWQRYFKTASWAMPSPTLPKATPTKISASC